ncbi:16S rRNA (guanine(527)-N(7))-methyltransferase RsmG [uncultured Jannaschia sp.]|uniref:16S rRNA (guanine(527)-N(7))-methyltransferase RsmG n=1 Tax=uncultured Jannaschia sp. TaxID=293347 RepID=UPI00260172E8|nr:16S rRNA (guanine(527)-N(7))-methyltransferase RsmG [uncultured Jannaschia sp.]
MTALVDVSRETRERLDGYVALLKKWNSRINLVSASTLDDVWERHIVDSLELIAIGGETGKWVDLGSGGGLPGLVLACTDRVHPLVLIESDRRKAEFLRTVRRSLGLSCDVIADRIEAAPPQGAKTITARALAPLTTLFGYATRHAGTDATLVFPKGEGWRSEVDEARREWDFDIEPIESVTRAGSVILRIREWSPK